MNYFPVFFDLRQQRVLLVGAGVVAARKLALLERAGARIRVVAPHVAPEIRAQAGRGGVELHEREFRPDDLEDARLVIVATSRHALNRWIARLCEARAIPVNVVDDRTASRFIVPALIDRDPVLIAVSTSGSAPALARRLRERIEAAVPQRMGALATWLAGLRTSARRRLATVEARRRFFELLIDGAAARRFLAGDRRASARMARALLAGVGTSSASHGEVTLVGAGPGDPELLTLRGLRALEDADLVLYDRLVNQDILELARRDARRIAVGKLPGGAGIAQEEINALMIAEARAGRRVVRLKGGDPFIFGRGGEELEALARARVPFAVVPGITAASGSAAYAGIPLTHRELAHGVTFVTGHGEREDWTALARPRHTVVFYMGLAQLDRIVARLIEHGAEPERPAALVAEGTSERQRVVTAPLGRLIAARERAAITGPALLVVGEVVSLQPLLGWFGLETEEAAPQSA